ncbi:MAG TPA: GAF domain-containing protein [Candidatus Bathyarchaeia archaeon]|nr:GAF domain-containing protein [Candidatus Bathyarchaeia archaeon]
MTRSRRPAAADVQPILAAIARTAARLCDATYANLHLVDGDRLPIGARHGKLPGTPAVGGSIPLTMRSVAGRAALERRTVHVRDLKASVHRYKDVAALQRNAGIRTILATPLLRDGQALGVLAILRTKVRPFTTHQIALLKTFAEQATIALENARLSRELAARNGELTEALGRETATGEILGVISRSPTDIAPVLSAVAESAARLCHAYDATVFRLEGDVLRLAAHHGPVEARPTLPVERGTLGGRSILEARPIQVADAQVDDGEFPGIAHFAREHGHRTLLSVPLVREGVPIGVIQLRRTEVAPFTDQQIALLQTFADQAVIAIENVRLFTELEQRNHDLTEALEQQTATAEILRAISSSPTDLRPVLETVVHAAARFCDAPDVAILRTDQGMLRMAAAIGPFSEEMIRRAGSLDAVQFPISRETVSGRSVVERRSLHVHDLAAEPEDEYPIGRDLQRRFGHRTLLCTPLLREGVPIGVMVLFRTEVHPFSDKQVRLSQTFADQAVIAIENVRLFRELGERNQELTDSLTQQTATAEILRVISSSPTDIQPVLDAITESAARLCDAIDTAIFLEEGEALRLATHRGPIALGPVGQFTVPMVRGTLTGRAALEQRTIQLADHQAEAADYPEGTAVARRLGVHTMLAIPLLHAGKAIGVIALRRTEVRLFSDQQIALLQTFADQAVIAIENVRLFTALGERNRDLTEALDQQTATSEILQAISSSPTDLRPVFSIIAESAARLCGAEVGVVTRVAGEWVELEAVYGSSPEGADALRRVFPMRPTGAAAAVRAIRDAAIAHIPDVLDDEEYGIHEAAIASGFRAALAVPLLREGRAIGSLGIGRGDAGEFSERQIKLLSTFADQALIAIENVRLFTELENRNHDLSESLEQQTATGEILRVISQSPTDVQPVFDVIVNNALRLCGARYGRVYRYDGSVVSLVASHGLSPGGLGQVQRVFPRPAADDTIVGRVIVTRQPVYVRDVERDETVPALSRQMIEALDTRSQVTIPMLRAGEPIGAMTLGWADPDAFDDQQVALLKTFADQAVIAIENVRLFTELGERNRDLTEALDHQTATSEILRVISQSQTDVQPVFDAIARSSVQLCDGVYSGVYQFDGDLIRMVANHGIGPDALAEFGRVYPLRLSEATGPVGRAIRDGVTLHTPDVQAEATLPEYARRISNVLGYRTQLVVPMMRQGACIGAISIVRPEVRPFSESIIALVQTFADQAVIAIENARLLTELRTKNSDLTESLDQQTATSEILRVISQSPTDVQPVFDAIARNARRLCDTSSASVLMFDGTMIHLAAIDNEDPKVMEAFRRAYPNPANYRSAGGRAVLTGQSVHIPDVLEDPDYEFAGLQGAGLRSVLCVPMLRHGTAIGAITVHTWAVARPFGSKQMELLETFADQAVIAVENARLFRELEARTAELTRSVEQLTALGEISQAVSSTLDVETVLQTIVSRATQLAGADGCAIWEYDDTTDSFHIRATHNLDPALVETLRASPLRKGEGTMGRAAETREPIQVADIAAPGAYQSHIRDTLLGAGYRALLSVPLLREDQIIGSLSLNRHTPGEFPPEAVEVLKTFATQSALAIQNARLFGEIEVKSRQLEAASQHKSEFLANMSHELRTPLNAIIGFSEVLHERMFGELNEKQDEYLKDIHASGTHLLSLINDILDLSKVEAGRMELELTDFNLPAAIESSLTLVRERALRRGITLRLGVDAGVGEVRADERKVRQVLLNLLSNAIKFTPEGGRIEVRAARANGAVDVAVSDTGIGIAPEDQEAVFEEFRQVGSSAAKQQGTGLGLTLCRKFVELHGGKIWVTSALGAGSTFTFRLPVRQG